MTPVYQERISITHSEIKRPKTLILEKVLINLKSLSNENLELEALFRQFICSPIKNQPINLAKANFDFLKICSLQTQAQRTKFDLLIGSKFYWSIVTGNVSLGK